MPTVYDSRPEQLQVRIQALAEKLQNPDGTNSVGYELAALYLHPLVGVLNLSASLEQLTNEPGVLDVPLRDFAGRINRELSLEQERMSQVNQTSIGICRCLGGSRRLEMKAAANPGTKLDSPEEGKQWEVLERLAAQISVEGLSEGDSPNNSPARISDPPKNLRSAVHEKVRAYA